MTKNLYMLFILIMLLNPGLESAYSENSAGSEGRSSAASRFNLEGDVLYMADKCGRIKLYDKVIAIAVDNNTIYYIRSSNERWIAGFIKENSAVSTEFKIPWKYEKFHKFAVCNDIFYYLADPLIGSTDEKSPVASVYVRFNPDQMTSQSVEGVSDFYLLGGKSIMLRDNLLDYNGMHIPLMLTGRLKISGIADSRIAFVSGGDGTEVVDLLAGKSIYQYKESSVSETPEDYNIILEFEDKFTAIDAENSIYYEVLVDGAEENRTETGRGELVKVFHSNLSPGSYHIIKPERWELDKNKGRYVRMNNVYQPSELKIYIPENRILKIKIEFNGTGYSINQSVLFE